MFNNLVNRHDLVRVWRKVRQSGLGAVGKKLLSSSDTRVEKSWSHTASSARHWWDIPQVEQRWNRLITGVDGVTYQAHIAGKYLQQIAPVTAVSLGCGHGERELRWAATGVFQRIDGYDLSAERIAEATRRAADRGLDGIAKFQRRNFYDAFPVDAKRYDIVLTEQSLHHFSPMEQALDQIKRFLKPGGLFIMNEFVGPTRFQWTDRQLEIVNGLLAVLPEKYRRVWNTGEIKRAVHRPGRLSMMLSDPSESIESARIMPLLREKFDIIESADYGGTILHLLFSDIAANFLGTDVEATQLLEFCFRAEDTLLAVNEIKSDFVFAVCKMK